MGRPQSNHPLILGLGATVAGSLLGGLLLGIVEFSGGLSGVGDVVGTAMFVGIYGSIIALPVVVAYGMPIFAILHWMGYANRVTAMLFGSLPGIIWVLWSHGSWFDPVLWNGVFISLLYQSFRQMSVETSGLE